LTGNVTFRVRTVMHRNPGQLHRVQVGIVGPKVSGAPSCGDGLVCARMDSPRTCPQETCQWWDEITVNTAWHAKDGWQEFRIKGYVKEPDGEEMIVSNGFHAYLRNGHPIESAVNNPDSMVARGWYTDAGYTNASIINPPTGPVSGVWEPQVRLDRGADGIPVVGYYIALDTDFHNANPGISVASGNSGPYQGRLQIDTRRLSNGWHRLFLKTDAFDSNTGARNSGVLSILFEVRN
jgi:hypothetical protein